MQTIQAAGWEDLLTRAASGGDMWGLRVASAVLLAGVIITSLTAPIEKNSNDTPTPIMPAGYAFAIWGFIWLLQIIAVVYGLVPGGSPLKVQCIEALSVYVPLAWLTLWVWAILQLTSTKAPVLSMLLLMMACVLFFLAWMRITSPEYAIDIATPFTALVHQPSAENLNAFFTAFFHWSVYFVPTATNLGWLLLASLINAASVAVIRGYVAETETALPVALIVLADIIAIALQQGRGDSTVLMVAIWGLVGVLVANKATPEVLTACWVSISVAVYLVLAKMIMGISGLAFPSVSDYAAKEGYVKLEL